MGLGGVLVPWWTPPWWRPETLGLVIIGASENCVETFHWFVKTAVVWKLCENWVETVWKLYGNLVETVWNFYGNCVEILHWKGCSWAAERPSSAVIAKQWELWLGSQLVVLSQQNGISSKSLQTWRERKDIESRISGFQIAITHIIASSFWNN